MGYLLMLGKKRALQIYQAALPAALTHRNYHRVHILARLGMQLGTSPLLAINNCHVCTGWENQSTFQTQCAHLLYDAVWWRVLRGLQVDFDPRKFDGGKSSSSVCTSLEPYTLTAHNAGRYVLTLLRPLLEGCAQKKFGGTAALELCTKFCIDHSLREGAAAQAFVEHALLHARAGMMSSAGCYGEKEIRAALRVLPSHKARTSVLRRCVRCIEGGEINKTNDDMMTVNEIAASSHPSQTSTQDYETFALAYDLYCSELTLACKERLGRSMCEKDRIELERAFGREMELIERRVDALAILLSYYSQKAGCRPHFTDFFEPFPREFGGLDTPNTKRKASVLISENSSSKQIFDPLLSLHDVLLNDPKSSTLLSPICCSLNIPPGYVPARLLQLQFTRAVNNSKSIKLPDFDECVCPILDRLNIQDAAKLAEWTSNFYTNGSKDLLLSLEVAHDLTTRVSSEMEKRSQEYSEQEMEWAIEKVRKVGDRLASVNNYSRIHKALVARPRSATAGNAQVLPPHPAVDQLLDEAWIDSFFCDSKGKPIVKPPEALMEKILKDASLLVATELLDPSVSFSMHDFAAAAWRIHSASAAVAGQYSHIEVYDIAQSLCRHWLVHGDDRGSGCTIEEEQKNNLSQSSINVNSITNSRSIKMDNNKNIESGDDDETVNFIMDLNSDKAQDIWRDDVGSNYALDSNKSSRSGTLDTQVDEDNIFDMFANKGRDYSEYVNARSALRIAFCLSYSRGYFGLDHFEKEELGYGKEFVTENSTMFKKPSFPFETNGKDSSSKKRQSILGLSAAKSYELKRNHSLKHARDILNIVFIKSKTKLPNTTTSDGNIDKTNNSDQCSATDLKSRQHNFSNLGEENKSISGGKTITFAMRYRALRAVSVLCPQELLEIVLKSDDQTFQTTPSREREHGSLSQCTFGSFVACEIEAMGLPLPHSDLEQLSSINFSSYARSLWRDFGATITAGARNSMRRQRDKGRLLLLLIDMCTKDRYLGEGELVLIAIKELISLGQFCELFSATEKICTLKTGEVEKLIALNVAKIGECKRILYCAMQQLSVRIVKELDKVCSNPSQPTNSIIRLLERFCRVYLQIFALLDKRAEVMNFGKLIFLCADGLPDTQIQREIMKLSCTLFHVGNPTDQHAMLEEMATKTNSVGKIVLKAILS
mmetsp:Transcript_27737/g.63557  ORF Transcript_27737/g.63557 Transcript_27737/m.63557 type:complete len:1167 (-) Transcript_27737:275-3775(-)